MNKTSDNIAKKAGRNIYSIALKEIVTNRQEVNTTAINAILRQFKVALKAGVEAGYGLLEEYEVELKPTRRGRRQYDDEEGE